MNKSYISILVIASTVLLLQAPVYSDSISPHMEDNAKGYYSDEKPDIAYYGTGTSGREMEASVLRMNGDRDLQDHNIAEATRVLSKAVELDPGDPSGHLLYARAITAQLFLKPKDPVDEKLLARCINEWKLIWRHDADSSEQWEARLQARKLVKIAKNLDKAKQHEKALVAEKTGAEPDKNSAKLDPQPAAVSNKKSALIE